MQRDKSGRIRSPRGYRDSGPVYAFYEDDESYSRPRYRYDERDTLGLREYETDPITPMTMLQLIALRKQREKRQAAIAQ